MLTKAHLKDNAGFFKRSLAYGVDLIVIYVYIIALFFASTAVDSIWPFHHLMTASYLVRHLISFFTLTFPTLLYFILMERSKRQATLGKSVLKLRVGEDRGTRASWSAIATRNILKFLPWEISHTHLHLNPQFMMTGETTALGWIAGIALPCGLVLVYVLMIVLRKDHRSFYELVSGTRVVKHHKLR